MQKLMTLLFLMMLGFGNTSALAAESPQALVENTSQEMLQALRKNREVLRADSSKVYGLVNQILLPHFDFALMSRWVLGKYWRQATPEQRKQFTEEFRTLLVRSYAGALLEYADEKIIFPPAPAIAADAEDATVYSEVQPKNGDAIKINYSLRHRKNAWKVYDVSVDGVSLVINYRSTFANQIRDQGMDALILDLRERNATGKE